MSCNGHVTLYPLDHSVVKRSKSKDSGRDKRELLTQGVSWPDGKKGEGNEMKGVASTAPVPEDPGQTVVINTEAT